MTLNFGRFCVMFQIFIGALIFLYPYPKRRFFLIRYLLSFSICLTIAFFFPMSSSTSSTEIGKIVRCIRCIIFFLLTVFSYWICFQLKIKIVLSLCSAGYALQHMGYQLSVLFHNLPLGAEFTVFVTDYHRIVEMVIILIVYLIFYLFIGRRIAKWHFDKNFNGILNIFSVFVVLVCIILSVLAGNSDKPVYVALYAILCCAMALLLQFSVLNIFRLHKENEAIQRKMDSDIARYESIKDAVEFINIKCHDLKKELNTFRDKVSVEEFDSLRNKIELYDNIPRTGNDIIDIVMLNVILHEVRYGINITFTGDGRWLNFMDDDDLKSLFMNAISNAIEAVMQVEPVKRTISIVLKKQGDMVVIVIRNYYLGERILLNKMPQSSKENPQEHGFGVRSMEYVAKRYEGNVAAAGNGGIFTLTITLIDRKAK